MSGISRKLMSSAGAGGAAEFTAIEDVFSTYLYTGNGTAQVIENGINLGQSNSGGSVKFDGDGDHLEFNNTSDFSFDGDFTVEFWVYPIDVSSSQPSFLSISNVTNDGFAQIEMNRLLLRDDFVNDIWDYSGYSLNYGEWYHLAVTRSGSTLYFFINGSLQATTTSSATIASGSPVGRIGRRVSSVGTQDSAFYMVDLRIVKGTAVYTSAFTPPTEPLTAISGTVLLTCQSGDPFVDNSSNAYTITQYGDVKATTFGRFNAAEAGEGGLVWIKGRSNTTGHGLFDTERGNIWKLESNTTGTQQYLPTALTSFNSNGFSLGDFSDYNGASRTYASWTWRKAPRFFDVVTVTAPASGTLQVPHNLGCEVGFLVIKSTSDSDNWVTYHRQLGVDKYLFLNLPNAQANSTGIWSDVTDSYFTLRVGQNCTAGRDYVVYLFAHDPLGPSGDGSDGLIACGSVTTDGSGVASVDLGWEPQWVLTKIASGTGGWAIADNMRGIVTGGTDQYLLADQSNAEASYTYLDLTPTGFNLSGLSTSSDYIYIAIRRGPMRVPESGTEVFKPSITTSEVSASVPNDRMLAATDLWINQRRDTTTNPWAIDRMRGWSYLDISARTVEASFGFRQQDQETLEVTSGTWWGAGTSQVDYYFKRAPNFFDIVAYDGTGSSQAINHNLGVAPDMMWIKRRDGERDWGVYVSELGNTGALILNDTYAAFTNETAYFNSTSPTSTDFTVGTSSDTNALGGSYIAYLFASLDGVSKVGSFTTTGSGFQNVDCGFTGGARFVLIKKTNAVSGWYVWDTARGISVGADPYLELNNGSAEVGGNDFLEPYNQGFTLVESNFGSGDWIFYAIA